ncbi:hypothetical protein FPV67DRAFT_1664153 [Lyophyllum atratum]|nr:hypothetical protein FPV67DRAFT_1664153 [Lyophyllum atratum]
MERKFGELNDKTMYLAPSFAKLVRVAAPEVELEQLSYYPLAMDPCFVGDPLVDLLPQYGHATALMCTPMPLNDASTSDCTSSSPSIASVEMADHTSRGSSTGSHSQGTHDDDSMSEDDSESCESSDEDPNWDIDAREYFSGAHLQTEDGTETSFYHDPRGASADDTLHPQSGVLDHRLLARLTLDLAEETTPLALTCLAQESEIYSVMSSALFQRRAWGIVGPMMGITFDRMGTTVRIIFGWLEETNASCGSIVHVLHEAAGAYDLSDPDAAIDFAILVGGEARRFAIERQRASEHFPQLLESISERQLKLWRVDQKDLASEFKRVEEAPLDSKVRKWLDSTDPSGLVPPYEDINGVSRQSSVKLSIMPESNASSQSKKTKKEGKGVQGSTDKKKDQGTATNQRLEKLKASSSQSSQITHTYHEGSSEAVPLLNAPPTSSPGSAASKQGSISASTLAAGGKHGDKSLLIRSFMFDRLATTRTLPVYSMLADSKIQIGWEFAKICKVYYEVTSFAWLSPADIGRLLSPEVQELSIVRHAKWACKGFESLGSIGRFPGVQYLTEAGSQVLARNLWQIDDVLKSVSVLRGNGWKQAKELECRIHFDRLLMLLFHGTANGTSGELSKEDYVERPHIYSLERSLSLPRGEVSEAISSFWEDIDISRYMGNIASEMTSPRDADSIYVTDFIKRLRSKPDLISFNPSIVPILEPSVRSTRPTPDAANVDSGLRVYAESCAQLTLQKDMESLARYLDNVEGTQAQFHGDARLDPPGIVDKYDKEPERAVCDSVGYLRIPSIFSTIAASKAFNIILPPTPSPRHSGRTTSSPDAPPHANGLFSIRQGQMVRTFDPKNSADIQATAQSQAIAVHALLKDLNEMMVTEDESASGIEIAIKHSVNLPVRTGGGTTLPQQGVLDMRKDLFLPLITTENKKAQATFQTTSVNQGRMYAIACTKFYAALGIYGMPVYTIITEGPIAVITVTYGEEWEDHPFDRKKYDVSNVGKEGGLPQPASKPTKVHIIERNVVSYDISKPLGILNFATFLIQLRIEHAPHILDEVGGAEGIKKRLRERGIPLEGTQVPKASWRNTRTGGAK